MNLWLKQWLLVVITIFILLNAFTLLAIEAGAPYRFTSSLSYDAKITFIKQRLVSGEFNEVDTIIIGSSMALNNIDSKTIEKHKGIDKVLNMSSWGLNTNDSLELLKAIELDKIKRVIYVAQYDDFTTNPSKVRFGQNMKSIKAFWSGDSIIEPYFQLLKATPLKLKRYLLWNKYYGDNSQYRNLSFNQNGDASLNIKEINYSRYYEFPEPEYLTDEHILPLRAMADYLKHKQINFTVARTPYRQPLLVANEKLNDVFISFASQIGELAGNEHFTFIDVHEKLLLEDKYFADKSHLNENGATLVSEVIASNL